MYNEEYARKVLPYLKSEYFIDYSEKFIFRTINDYVEKYNNLPSMEALFVIVNEADIAETTLEGIDNTIQEFLNVDESNLEWLFDLTEQFCQDKAIYNTIMESVEILEGKHETYTRLNIPEMMSKG